MRYSLTRIGIIYDGSFLSQLDAFYKSDQPAVGHLDLSALQAFFQREIARREGSAARLCPIVESHCFHGSDTSALNLEKAGIVSHPAAASADKERSVWLALEALEIARSGRIDLLVLVAGQRTFVPLARRVAAQGVRVMVPGWDGQYRDQQGRERTIKVAAALLDAASHAMPVADLIAEALRRDGGRAKDLPRSRPEPEKSSGAGRPQFEAEEGPERHNGKLVELRQTCGFIDAEAGGRLFFHESEVAGVEFSELRLGSAISFQVGRDPRGRLCGAAVSPGRAETTAQAPVAATESTAPDAEPETAEELASVGGAPSPVSDPEPQPEPGEAAAAVEAEAAPESAVEATADPEEQEEAPAEEPNETANPAGD